MLTRYKYLKTELRYGWGWDGLSLWNKLYLYFSAWFICFYDSSSDGDYYCSWKDSAYKTWTNNEVLYSFQQFFRQKTCSNNFLEMLAISIIFELCFPGAYGCSFERILRILFWKLSKSIFSASTLHTNIDLVYCCNFDRQLTFVLRP